MIIQKNQGNGYKLDAVLKEQFLSDPKPSTVYFEFSSQAVRLSN